MENTVTISLEKYEKFKYQQVEINELQKLLEDKSIVVEHIYNTSFSCSPTSTLKYNLKEYESKVIKENVDLYNELNETKKSLSKYYEKLLKIKNKSLFKLIRWWFKNRLIN